MLKEEFLKLTGLEEISDEDYKDVEMVYEDLSLNKEDFCASSVLTNRQAMDWCIELVRGKRRAEAESARLQKDLHTLAVDVVLGYSELAEDEAYDVLGESTVVRVKIANRKELDERDLNYIANNLK